MKYNNSNYIQLSRNLFSDKYKNLTVSAKWLYVVLNELEHKYTSPDKRCFYRTDEELALDANLSVRTTKRAKSELKESGLIKIGKSHFVDENGNRSKASVTIYEIPRSEKKAYHELGMKEFPLLEK